MAEGKWIDGLHAAMPVVEAARVVFAARFAVVRENLPRAVQSPYADNEYVHQLRVGARRCRAALEAFRDCLPKKDVKEARESLRTLRQAAGDARDWDVFIESLQSARALQAASGKPSLDFLFGYALGQRSAAQARLVDAAHKAGPDFLEQSTALPEHLREPRGDNPPESFGELADNDLGSQFDSFVDAVEANPNEPAELHKLRILGKHLRYAMEIYQACFMPALKDKLYVAIEELQELLGGLQDATVGIERLEGLRDMARQTMPAEWPRLRTGTTKLIQSLRAKVRGGRKKFQSWRSRWETLVAEHPLAVVKDDLTESLP
jgi:CHAD domain-containing protein